MALPSLTGLDAAGDVFLRDDPGPTIAEHALQCSDGFTACMAAPSIATDPTLMDDQLARFRLWASNMNVFGPPNVSLDYRLRYSPIIVDIIHQLLDVIDNALAFLKPVENSPQTPTSKKRRTSGSGRAEITKRVEYSSSTDSDEDQVETKASLITYTIGGTLSQLFRLSNAVRKSSKAARADKIAEYKADETTNHAISELRLYTECYIRFRFPHASEALLSVLVEANALRLRRLCYQRAHRKRVALSVQHPPENAVAVQQPKLRPCAPAVHFASTMAPKPEITLPERSKPTGVPMAPTTHATTAKQTAVRALYDDVMTETPRAKSVAINSKLSLPPAPKTNECPYCGVILDFNGSIKPMRWTNHVIQDLEPFVCASKSCAESSTQRLGPLTFDSSKAWTNHMQSSHGHIWECRAPSHNPVSFKQEAEFQEHSRTEHGVAEAHLSTLSGAARRPAFQKIHECPFGDEFATAENAVSSSIFSSEALQLHVATHMKEIALLALQKLPCDDDRDLDEMASSLLSDDNGTAKLRGSMYSVLDDESLDFLHDAEDNASDIIEKGITSSVNKLDLEERDEYGMTILHRSVLDNNLPLVRSFIDQGGNLRSRASNGKTALHYASLCGNLDMMRVLLDSEARELTSLKDDRGQTPLHCAAENDSIDGIQLLAEYGAFLDIPDENGFSPFLWAAIAGKYRATELLLVLGADMNFTGSDGKSALAWAASLGHRNTARLLLHYKANILPSAHKPQLIPLGEAAACGDLYMVQLLLNGHADINHRDPDGWLTVHWAAEEGHWEIVNLLVEHGADIKARSSYGTSLLHCAANGGHNKIVSLLLEAGADALSSTCHGWTPLHHAAFLGHSDVVKSLLEHDSTAGLHHDNHGWTPLHLAVYGRNLDTVELLIENAAVWKSRLSCDESGLTAADWLDFELDSHSYKTIGDLAFHKSRCCRAATKLRQAARNSNISTARLLLDHGHSVNESDSGQRTALYYAAKNGHMNMLNLLLGNGADPNILPAGRGTWEGFISDIAVLQQLRESGYKRPVPNEDIDQQINFVLRNNDTNFTQSLSQGLQEGKRKGDGALHSIEGQHRSSVTKLWERLRGREEGTPSRRRE